MGDLATLIAELVSKSGLTKGDFAQSVEMPKSRLSHLLSGKGAPPGIAPCLRIAHATGTSASRVLRAAGKGDIADLLEDLYGPAAERRQRHPPTLNAEEIRREEMIRRMAPEDRRFVTRLINRIGSTTPNKASAHERPRRERFTRTG